MRRLVIALCIAVILPPAAGCYRMLSSEQGAAGIPFRDPDRIINKSVWSWSVIKREHIVMQKHDYSCGPACLATILRYYWGDQVTEKEFIDEIANRLTPEELEDRIANGLSMTDLRLAAVRKGYVSSIGRVSLGQLMQSKVPVIVRVDLDEHEHFVVVRGFVEDRVYLADPIRGNVRLSIDKFRTQWTDGAILVVVKPGVEPPTDAPLLVAPSYPVRPELDSARRSLYLRD